MTQNPLQLIANQSQWLWTNIIKWNKQYQQQSKRLCTSSGHPDPGRAQSLCRENRPAAEVPERTTVALISFWKIDHWSNLCTQIGNVHDKSNDVHFQLVIENRPIIDAIINGNTKKMTKTQIGIFWEKTFRQISGVTVSRNYRNILKRFRRTMTQFNEISTEI